MIVEISPDDCAVSAKTIKGTTMYEQNAYLHFTGKPFPLPFKLNVKSGAAGYEPGKYTLSPDSVRCNQYGALEFDRYNMSLVKISDKGLSENSTKDSTTTPPGK